MSVLVFVELFEGKLKKNTWEISTYGVQLADARNTDCIALAVGITEAGELKKLGDYGISKVLFVEDEKLNTFTSIAFTKAIVAAAEKVQAEDIIFANNSTGKTLAPRVAIKLNASLLAGVSALPANDNTFTKTVFSGKAFTTIKSIATLRVISVNPNSIKPELKQKAVSIENITMSFSDSDFDYKVVSVIAESDGHVPLPEADLVVSAGRGMKGPENWGIIEELADALGATTACSRPVADIGWRPHHEHVGQTGITIKPSLYIAIGISGAIQHLAGVNQSKCIVVINKDPEAPFFKAADYGIVGDAFDIVPKLTTAIKKIKSNT